MATLGNCFPSNRIFFEERIRKVERRKQFFKREIPVLNRALKRELQLCESRRNLAKLQSQIKNELRSIKTDRGARSNRPARRKLASSSWLEDKEEEFFPRVQLIIKHHKIVRAFVHFPLAEMALFEKLFTKSCHLIFGFPKFLTDFAYFAAIKLITTTRNIKMRKLPNYRACQNESENEI